MVNTCNGWDRKGQRPLACLNCCLNEEVDQLLVLDGGRQIVKEFKISELKLFISIDVPLRFNKPPKGRGYLPQVQQLRGANVWIFFKICVTSFSSIPY